MPRTPKVYLKGKIYEVCFRTEEGLPMVCTPYMNVIIHGILAQASSMYAITLFHFVFMANHLHMHLRVDDPEQLDDYVAYIKRELSHAINNLLGRQRHTVWQAGYDAVIILDAGKMLERIRYLYLNPARAGCVESIDHYPGVSSWKAMVRGKWELKGRRIPREQIPALPRAAMSVQAQREFADALLKVAKPENVVEIDPMGWVGAFGSEERLDKERLRKELLKSIRGEEELLNARRDKPVIGAHALQLQSMRQPHTPKKFGKKMWCFGSTKEIRLRYINWRKIGLNIRAELKKSLPLHQFFQQMPAGFFLPGGCLLANLIPSFVPI